MFLTKFNDFFYNWQTDKKGFGSSNNLSVKHWPFELGTIEPFEIVSRLLLFYFFSKRL
jgi:hypothetical protein